VQQITVRLSWWKQEGLSGQQGWVFIGVFYFCHLYLFNFTGVALFFFKKRKKQMRGRAEDAGISPVGALVSNPENKRGAIKAFIVSSRSCLGT
jgi:hypothetical protein